MKKLFLLIISLLLTASLLASCNSAANDIETESPGETETKIAEAPREDVGEMFGTYYRQNDDNSPFAFTITLSPEGTYNYCESAVSSHLGYGKYTVEGNVITLIDDNIPTATGSVTYSFKFEYRDGKLIFLASESDNFMYVNLPEGAVFERAPET